MVSFLNIGNTADYRRQCLRDEFTKVHRPLRCYRVKLWALPASTLIMLPVDFAAMSEARK